MTSIRRTLLLNVVLLLAVTLGVVSYFVYRTAAGAMRERQDTLRELAEVRFEDRRDQALRNRADELAGEVQSNWNGDELRKQWIASEVLAVTTPMTSANPLPQTVRAVAASYGPVGFELNVRLSTEVRLNDDELYKDPEAAAHEFLQVSSGAGATWSSRSLAGQLLEPDDAALRRDSEAHSRFDDMELSNNVRVRYVVIKAPVTKFSRVGSFWIPRVTGDSPPPSRAVVGIGGAARFIERRAPQPPVFIAPPTGPRALPNFYLVCAWNTSPDNPRLAPLIQERDAQLAVIDSETERAVGSLRATLAWTVAGALVAALLGGWVLVGIGLFPLKRLSFAVSQISPKDFHLPLDPRTLPAEVNPVVERLSQSLSQLQAAFEREKRASADISHELRTPLAALTTTIEVACRKSRTAEQYRQTLDECRGIAKQMSLLVERMLMLAWLDAGADQMRSEMVEVGELVGGVAAIGKPLAEVQGLAFHVHAPKSLTVVTDPDKLREVVMNLLHNAIEYNRPGGEVELTAGPTAAGGVMVEVRDTGIGMTPETQAKIFDRFFRADPSRQATGVHAGLGLAIVKEYVDRLGGRLTVDSAFGLGTRFRVELPNAL